MTTPISDLVPRRAVAGCALAVAAALLAVAASQLFGPATDPRDTLGSRSAGFGFTDTGRQVLFGVIPLALPVVAVWADGRRLVCLLATVEYLVMLGCGVVVAVTAFGFGLDPDAQRQTGGAVFITPRAAVESLVIDVAMLVLVALGLAVTSRAWRRARAAEAA